MRRILLICVACAFLAACGNAATEITLVKGDPTAKISYTCPAWSPDGRSIAYIAVPNDSPQKPAIVKSGENIWIATFIGGHWKHRLLLRNADYPVWSPDSKKLAFARNGVCVLNLSTKQVRRLNKDYISPIKDDTLPGEGSISHSFWLYPTAWMPNGRHIIYEGVGWEQFESYVFDFNLNMDVELPLGDCYSWSPDGRYLLSAFNLGQFGPGWKAFEGEPTRIVRADLKQLKWQTVLKGYSTVSSAWPDEGRYAWVTLIKPEGLGGKVPQNPPNGPGIYRLDLQTKRLMKVSDIEEEVLYSPDFKRFVFKKAGSDNKYDLYVGDTCTWQFRLLEEHVAEDVLPVFGYQDRMSVCWSPDGESLAYATSQGDIKIVKFDGR